MKKVVAVIPARYASSRFPGKPLAKIHDKPMIQWVYESVRNVEEINEVYVATDDKRIFDAVKSFGGKVIMTSEKHKSGTDRVFETVTKIYDDIDIVLNIQGDEPMIKEGMISQLVSAFEDETVNMATLKKRLYNEEDINNPNIAKVITDINNDAIYFSRSTIPYNREMKENIKYYKHIGIYAYKKNFLMKFTTLKNSILEELEQLEQLRVIENGYKIRVIETEHESIGVDLPEHIEKVENLLK